MAEYYVVDGAVLMCNKSDKTSNLKVSGGRRTFIENRPQANIQDYVAKANIKPFGGCALRKKKPCKNYINIAPAWKKGKKDVIIEGDIALLRSSKLKCGIGGTISVVMTGQSIEFDRAVQVPIPAPVTPLIPPKGITNDDVLVKVNVPAKNGVILLINAKIKDNFEGFLQETKSYNIALSDCFRDLRKQSHFYYLKRSRKKADIDDFDRHGIGSDVSTPGRSFHNAGLAFDLIRGKYSKEQLKSLAEIANRHGFYRTVKREPWHFSYNGKVGNIPNSVAISLGYKDWKTMVKIVQDAYNSMYGPYNCPYGNKCGLGNV